MYSGICLIYILDVNDIYFMSWYMYNYQIIELICAKDENIGHSVTHDIKKMYKNIKGNVENGYVMQGRGIVKEIVRIRSELNCMHQDYSILHQTSLGKVDVLLHNSNIYIYLCRWTWWQLDISTWNWLEDQD